MKRWAVVALVMLPSLALGQLRPDLQAEQDRRQLRNKPVAELSRANLPAGREAEALAEIAPWDFRRLIRLRDQKTIDEQVADFAARRGVSRGGYKYLAGSCSPWLLPKLAPLLYEEDVLKKRLHEGWRDHGYSMSVAEIMTEIAATAPEFSEDVRKAARARWSGQRNIPNHRLIYIMRGWWERNAEAIEAERYADVTPMTDADEEAGRPPGAPTFRPPKGEGAATEP